MTKQEEQLIYDKIEQLLKEHTIAVAKTVVRKLHSGGINIDVYDLTNYSLPKVLLTSALQEHVQDFAPSVEPYKEDVANLQYF